MEFYCLNRIFAALVAPVDCQVINRPFLLSLLFSFLFHLMLAIAVFGGNSSRPVTAVKEGHRIISVRLLNDSAAIDGLPTESVLQAESPKPKIANKPASVGSMNESPGILPVDEHLQENGEGTDVADLKPALEYIPTDSLSVRPYPITLLDEIGVGDVDPSQMIGRVVLKVWISASGEVVDTEVLVTDMPEPFLRGVVEAFMHMRFMPGQLRGATVGCVMKVEINGADFRLPVQ